MTKDQEPSEGERLLACLQNIWRGIRAGTLKLAPEDVDPLLACEWAGITAEFVTEDARGCWSLHVPDAVLRYDPTWRDCPWRLLSLEDWAFYCDMLEVAEELGSGPDDARGE
jgi:hypothetical protein